MRGPMTFRCFLDPQAIHVSIVTAILLSTHRGNLDGTMSSCWLIPDNKVHGANMGPIWGRQDPGGLHVGPMNFAIWDGIVR